ncbi:MAG TPA: hypothetical protein VFK41_08780 [Nocardioidaceae bacterium]|nr:hypothetical protein [Nocardioidaceae bacterium]
MRSRRIARWAALAAATAWTVKSIAIGAAGGLDKSPLEGPLFFAGLLAFVVAAVALGVGATSGSPTWVRALAGIGSFVFGFALTMVVDGIVGSFHSAGVERHWVWVEFNLWVSACVAVALAVWLDRERARG